MSEKKLKVELGNLTLLWRGKTLTGGEYVASNEEEADKLRARVARLVERQQNKADAQKRREQAGQPTGIPVDNEGRIPVDLGVTAPSDLKKLGKAIAESGGGVATKDFKLVSTRVETLEEEVTDLRETVEKLTQRLDEALKEDNAEDDDEPEAESSAEGKTGKSGKAGGGNS